MELKIRRDGRTHKVRLEFLDCGDRVEVVAVDEGGNTLPSGHLIGFEDNGTIRRYLSVDRALGFKQDRYGRIKLYNEE